jgi:hypothetical protein
MYVLLYIYIADLERKGSDSVCVLYLTGMYVCCDKIEQVCYKQKRVRE